MAHKTFTYLFILMIVGANSFAQAPDTIWTKIYGGVEYDNGKSIIKTEDNGFAIVGQAGSYFSSGILTNGDIWLIRTDSSGDTLWTKSYGNSGIDEGNSIHQTSDGGFILAGAISNNLLFFNGCLLKTDSNGDSLWAQTYDENTEGYANSVIETSDSGFVFTGTVSTQTTFSKDVWLVRTDASGNILWNKTYGVNGEDIGYAVLQTPDGGFIVTGRKRLIGQERDVYLIRTDENGDTLWTKTYNGPSSLNSVDEGRDIELMEDGGFAILGFTSLNVWLLRTDANGDTLWTRQYSGGGNKMHKTSDGGFIITGGVWLIRVDSTGNLIWSRPMEGLSEDVIQTSDGGYVVAGYNFLSATKDDLWIAKFGSSPTSIENLTEKPGHFSLSQNYPNPFNPITKIRWNLPSEAFVTLKVYDILGNEITELVNEFQSAGYHTIEFNGSSMTSGIYFYRLSSGSFTATKKMIIMK